MMLFFSEYVYSKFRLVDKEITRLAERSIRQPVFLEIFDSFRYIHVMSGWWKGVRGRGQGGAGLFHDISRAINNENMTEVEHLGPWLL